MPEVAENGVDASTGRALVAVDTGGTFTDLVAVASDGTWRHLKVPSTPDDPARAILAGLAALGVSTPELRHGTTVATNAVLERRGARVLLVTTAGFEDLLALGRQARPALYALHPTVPAPLVDRGDVLGYPGRLDGSGRRLAVPENDGFVAALRAALPGIEAVAVCTLHGYAHPVEEAEIVAAVRARSPGVFISVSHEVAPVMREFERASTTVVNAYVAPVMDRYLARLAAALPNGRIAIMGSAGGLSTVADARRRPVDTVLSGPAGGVRGAHAVGRRLGLAALLAVDMGGTSTDVSVITDELLPEDDGALGPHPLRISLLPIETVGAGGGSVAWIDDGGALRVGPHSAGATPGPACYGRGGEQPTVTDAHVVLGRLTTLVGGAMTLDVDAAHRAISRVAVPLGLSVPEAARAIVETVEATMARACRRVSSERGVDPRGLALVAFGGAAGLHACRLADELGCRTVVFPREPGLLSAEGMLEAPFAVDRTRPCLVAEASWPAANLAAAAGSLVADVEAALSGSLPGPDDGTDRREVRVVFDMRYQGQTHTLPVLVPLPFDAQTLRTAFDAMHRARFGHALPGDHPAELVSMRCLGRVYPSLPRPEPVDAPATVAGAGWAAVGPAMFHAYSATLLVPPGWSARQGPTGDVVCTAGAPAAASTGLEIHRQRVSAIAEEMGHVLMRAAFSANIKERRDFSCAVFDADGGMVEHAAHIPVHLGSTPLSVEAARAAVSFAPGTQVLLNDPFSGGTHLPDVTLVTPVFAPEAASPVFFVANRAHHADVGGIAAGSLPAPRGADGSARALTIDDEGFRLPPTVLDDATRTRFVDASRVPGDRKGDLAAQEAANAAGVRALTALVARCGLAEVRAWNAALRDYAERRMRAVLAALPPGTATFTDFLDDDGLGDAPIPLPVTVTLGAGTAEFDFRAAPDQVAGPMNAVRAIVVSAVFYVLECLAGGDLPANAGLLRPVTILTRPGSIVDADPPAAVSAGNVETSQRLVDAIFGALALLAPGRIPAASGGSMNNVLFGGVDAAGAPFVHYETLGGGAGASAEGPGLSGRHTHMTNTLNTPVEALERAFPVTIEGYALRPVEPAPPGEFSGGAGVRRIYRFHGPAEVTVVSERRRLAPWGLGGAAPGASGRNRLVRANGEVVPLPGKITLRVEAGDRLEVETPGGGGWRAASDQNQNSRQSAGMSTSPNA
jgi:5-oxoprolinase (ATP-hydrolysing)